MPIFFVIFDENDVLYILVEFETDRMSPRESAKNGRIGAHGLNCKIFVNSELRFEIYDEKNFMSLQPFWNFRHPAWPVPRRDSLLIRYILIIRSLFLQVNGKLNLRIQFDVVFDSESNGENSIAFFEKINFNRLQQQIIFSCYDYI